MTLTSFGQQLDALQHEVIRGRGFVLLRGIPVDGLSIEETAALYWGLGAYFGSARTQNVRGHLLGHVTNVQDKVVERARGYLTNRHLLYHCDFVDIVSLLCLRKSKSGGLSSLVSSHTIHNEMWRRRPYFWRNSCTALSRTTVTRKSRQARDPGTNCRSLTTIAAAFAYISFAATSTRPKSTQTR